MGKVYKQFFLESGRCVKWVEVFLHNSSLAKLSGWTGKRKGSIHSSLLKTPEWEDFKISFPPFLFFLAEMLSFLPQRRRSILLARHGRLKRRRKCAWLNTPTTFPGSGRWLSQLERTGVCACPCVCLPHHACAPNALPSLPRWPGSLLPPISRLFSLPSDTRPGGRPHPPSDRRGGGGRMVPCARLPSGDPKSLGLGKRQAA